jgi:hypothetical protein
MDVDKEAQTHVVSEPASPTLRRSSSTSKTSRSLSKSDLSRKRTTDAAGFKEDDIRSFQRVRLLLLEAREDLAQSEDEKLQSSSRTQHNSLLTSVTAGRFILSEAIKHSRISIQDIYALLRDYNIAPDWEQILLSYGRVLSECKELWHNVQGEQSPMNSPPSRQQFSLLGEQFSEYEKRYVLAEICKKSSLSVLELSYLLVRNDVQPRWDYMFLPIGCHIQMCKEIFTELWYEFPLS